MRVWNPAKYSIALVISCIMLGPAWAQDDNAVSTGVGNAGSFGIGSGTANGNADSTASAYSNGDSHNVSTSDYHGLNVTAGFVAVSTGTLSQSVSGIPGSTGGNVPNDWHTGTVNGAIYSGSSGINLNASNSGVSSNIGIVNTINIGIAAPLQ